MRTTTTSSGRGVHAVVAGDPDAASADHQVAGAEPDPNRRPDDPVRLWVDPGHGVVVPVARPGRTRAVGDPVGLRVDPRHVVAPLRSWSPRRPPGWPRRPGRPADRDGRHRAAGRQVDAGHRVLARRRDPLGRRWRSTAPIADGDGLSVRRDAQWLADGRVGRRVDPDHRAGGVQHPKDPVGHGRAPGAGKGMAAANRPRSKAGTVTPVPVGVGGGWVDRGVLGVSATSAHAAAASSTATTSVLCQRGAPSGDGRRLAGLAWPSSPPRAPEWSILPTHTGWPGNPRTQRGLPDPP